MAFSFVVALTVLSPAATHVWDVTVKPPAMTNPTTITLPGNYLTTISHSSCTGPGYIVNLDDSKDYIIRTNSVLHDPVHINGGRNVRIIGIHMDLATAACATTGLSGRVPAMRALNVNQVGTTFIEGAYIDLKGRSADCIVGRNRIGSGEALSKGYSEVAARGAARDIIIQNSVCRGFSGEEVVHGDILQTQGLHELYRDIIIENLTTDSNCEGLMIDSRDGYSAANSIILRRFDYRQDPRYTPNPKDGGYWTGGPVMHSAKAYIYNQVYLDHDIVREYSPNGSVTRVPCNANNGVYCPALPSGTDRFASPGMDAADSAWTGLNYVSPHDNTSATQVAAPTISPNGGSYKDSVIVSLATSTSGASIYYTLNDSTPNQSSTLYKAPFTLKVSVMVRARAFKSGSTPSAVSGAVFTITTQPIILSATGDRKRYQFDVILQANKEFSFKIRDIHGRTLWQTTSITGSDGYFTIQTPSTLLLRDGIYFASLQQGDYEAIGKFIRMLPCTLPLRLHTLK